MSNNQLDDRSHRFIRGQKISLQQFQADLIERLRLSKTAPLGATALGVQIGSMNWLIDLTEAGEIMPVTAPTSVPLTKPWFKGLVNIRGELSSVVDLNEFYGQGPTPLYKESRILAFSTRLEANAGILVSRMLGLKSVYQMKSSHSKNEWGHLLFTDPQGQTWARLSLKELIKNPEFLTVGKA